MSIKFLVFLVGGVFGAFGGGESADFIFMGAGIFLLLLVHVGPKRSILVHFGLPRMSIP